VHTIQIYLEQIMKGLSTPVVLILFNRPRLTEKVFEAIARAQPRYLYVIADGPRDNYPQERELCDAARAVVEEIGWDCQVFRNYSQINLGCRHRIFTGLNWVFAQVDEAIILEDDCVPDESFFLFCSKLLDRYKTDKRIMSVSGNNFQFGQSSTDDSYYFSRYPHCWGWATWGRAWKHCDIDLRQWCTANTQDRLQDVLESSSAIRYWQGKFQKTFEREIDSWAFCWTFSCWMQSGLTILPDKNLVSNIGFASDGTHHKTSNNPFACIPAQKMDFPLRHPDYVLRNSKADSFTQRNMFGIVSRSIRKIKALLYRA